MIQDVIVKGKKKAKMRLYKFKCLEKIKYVNEIIEEEKLYCSEYSKLNDPFEGLFFEIIKQGSFSPSFTKGFDRIEKQVKEILYPLKVCSLSKKLDDVRMWSFYANDHKGIAIEIDFAGFENEVEEVLYLNALPEYNLETPNPAEILKNKTKHWCYESEYRIIQKNEYYPIKGRICSVYIGNRILDDKIEILKKIVPKAIPIYRTKLEPNDIKIIPGDILER